MIEDGQVLLNTRAGTAGEDWLAITAELWPGGALDRVTIRATGGLSSAEISLDRDEAARVIDALRAFLEGVGQMTDGAGKR